MEASDSLRQKKIKFFLSYTWHIHMCSATRSVRIWQIRVWILRLCNIWWDILMWVLRWMSILMPAMTGPLNRWRKSLIWASNEENSLLAAEFDECRTVRDLSLTQADWQARTAEKIRLIVHHFTTPITTPFARKSTQIYGDLRRLWEKAKIKESAKKPEITGICRLIKGYKIMIKVLFVCHGSV